MREPMDRPAGKSAVVSLRKRQATGNLVADVKRARLERNAVLGFTNASESQPALVADPSTVRCLVDNVGLSY